MQEKNLRSIFPLFALIIAVTFFSEGRADYAVLGGYGQIGEGSDAPTYPIADTFAIGNNSASPITMPQGFQGTVSDVAVDSFTGAVLYVGNDSNNIPFIFKGSVVSSEIVIIAMPAGLGSGTLDCAAFDSDGTAFIAGQDFSNDLPLILKLPSGATEATRISIAETDNGEIDTIAITLNNTAILGGQNLDTLAPIIYAIPTASNEATLLVLPDPAVTGIILTIAVAPNGTTILAGQNSTPTNGEALIYSMPSGSLSLNSVAIPGGDDGGIINQVAIAPDGTAVLAGSTFDSESFPLIYRIPLNSSLAVAVANPNEDPGLLLSVAIGSDGTALLGGNAGDFPLLYKLAPSASQATLIQLPNDSEGGIISIGIGSQDVAVIGGGYFDTNQLLLFTMPITANSPSAISTPNTLNDEAIVKVLIYDFDGLYDIRRLRPPYYFQKDETINQLRQAGLL
jgi:hypothetical protein